MTSEPEHPAVEQHRGYLLGLARLQLHARPWLAKKLDASDLVQNVLLKAHAARDQFRGQSDGELAVWLKQILHRTLANEIRDLTRDKRDVGAERSLEADLEASAGRIDAWLAADQTSPSVRAVRNERVTELAAAVDALPSDQREVILMKHCEGLSLAAIADRLDRTPAAIAGLLRRGLERLRHLLNEAEPT